MKVEFGLNLSLAPLTRGCMKLSFKCVLCLKINPTVTPLHLRCELIVPLLLTFYHVTTLLFVTFGQKNADANFNTAGRRTQN